MYRLCDVFEIPEEMRYYNIMVFDKEEALCIFLKRFAHPCRYQDLMLRIVQRALPQLCMISNQVQNIYENWVFLLRNINQSWLSRRNLEVFAEVIHIKGAPLDNCWGFVDGTTRPVALGKIKGLWHYERFCCIKFQSAVAPNGRIRNFLSSRRKATWQSYASRFWFT